MDGNHEKASPIILLVGLFTTLCTGHTFFTCEKSVGWEEIEITRENGHTENWQLYFGIGIMLIGVVVLVPGVDRIGEKTIREVMV
jgi:hypothetical protein